MIHPTIRTLTYSNLICLVCLSTAFAETVEFSFARSGISYSAAMFADDPLVGKEIVGAKIVLNVESFPKSDAGNFVTDMALPIDPHPGNTRAIVLTGKELGWSGSGVFSYLKETDRFNGFFVPSRYGAATYAEGFSGEILDGRIELNVPNYVRGDFNDDLTLDAQDMDLLSRQVRSNEFSRRFDLNFDNAVDQRDRSLWLEKIKRSYFGDANLDGEFNSRDLVLIFQAAEYEDNLFMNSGWASGDWNGDGDFTSSDLVLAFESGGYENGPRRLQTVPEPTHHGYSWLIFPCLARLAWIRHRKTKTCI